MTTQPLRLWMALLAALALGGCAQGVGGNVGDDDDDDDVVDARKIDATPGIDAPQAIDATQPIDARIDASTVIVDASPLPIDGGGGGLFCASTADCGAGTCCFPPGGTGLCVPGTEVIPGICFPNT